VFQRFVISTLLAALTLPAVARTRPHYGGTLHVEIEGDAWSGSGNSRDGLARQLVFNGLTRLGNDGMVQRALAIEWQSDDSAHRWQFRLRPGVQFHDGSPLTATAVVQALNLSCNANCPWTAVRPVGSSVVFTSDSPTPNLPALLAGDKFLIALTAGADGATPVNAIGTGPFRFSAINNDTLTLTANDGSWEGRPFVDSIEIRAHRSIHDQWLDLSVGRADIVEVPPQELRRAQQQRLAIAVSPSVDLLALQISDTALANPMLRASIAAAVDRGALFNVIFQKQGEITGSLLPQELTGYSFLFSTDRDMNKAHALRGGLTAPLLTLGFDGDGAMQLAAQRLALNLREAGFDVQAIDVHHSPHPDLILCKLPLEGADASAALEVLLRAAGETVPASKPSPITLFHTEREFLDRKTLVPLLDLPRAYAIGSRVRDLKLRADGTPDLAAASLEDAP
jgi:peptide/nickel transport system substrate-binding protein